MTLDETRLQWEKGLKPLTVIQQHEDTVLVVLEKAAVPKRIVGRTVQPGSNTQYYCHRYFQLADGWVCSADGQRVPLAAVFSWLNGPTSSSTMEENYIFPELAGSANV